MDVNNQADTKGFARIVSGDVGETLAPIIVVTRRPDGSGLYQHYKGICSALEGAVYIKTLFLGENATIDNIRRLAWENGFSSVIFCEAFYDFVNPADLKILKDEVGLKVSLVFAWDSTQLDPRDVSCINECVDVLLPVCAEFAVAWKDQISPTTLVRHLRLPLPLLAYETLAPVRSPYKSGPINILCMASYHPRKNHVLAINAVKKLIDNGVDCRLRLHSNLDQGEFEVVKQLGGELLGSRFIATYTDLSNNEILELYRRHDIYLSCSQGEGCNIGLRTAFSSGMPIVFTNIPGHRDLLDFKEGIFAVEPSHQVPGIYPERSNQTFGYQLRADVDTIAQQLENAISYFRSRNFDPVTISKQNARQDERRSKIYIWDLLASSEMLCTLQRLEARRNKQDVNFEDVLIVPSLDAGFFSIVNTYLSHKLFWEYPSLYNKVIPIWSPEMVSLATGKSFGNFTSYCYSKPEDGNAFDHLFGDISSPVAFGINVHSCTFAGTSANAWIDPNLTYIHSEKLYKSAVFGEWRKEMSRVCWGNMRFQSHVLLEISQIVAKVRQFDIAIAMHVRHPSHAMEQRDKSIALVEDYVRVAQGFLETIGNDKACAIVLATDQEEVVLEFEKNFPGQVIYRQNVSRVSVSNSQAEKSIAADVKLTEGRQIQHLMASNIDGWNLKNAYDVIADALLLSMANVLVHVNSNIATIVSIYNQNITMLHIKGNDNIHDLLDRTSFIDIFKPY